MSLNLTPRETEILLAALLVNSGSWLINYQQLADALNLKDAKSASTQWYKVKHKLDAAAAECMGGAIPAKKRTVKGGEGDGDGEDGASAPTKKSRKTAAAKGNAKTKKEKMEMKSEGDVDAVSGVGEGEG